MATVICGICQQEFVKHNGRQIYCGQDCYKEARRRQSHTPEQRARGARKKQRQRERNPEHMRELTRQSRARHRDEYNAANREWNKKNPNYSREHSRKWRAEHPGYKQQEQVRYYQKHKDEVAARVKARRQANPEIMQVAQSRRRARKLQAEGDHTWKQFKELCKQVDWYCAYCREQFDKLTPDHIIPLSRGGSNDISNIIPACGPCNYSKQDKTPLEYLIRFRF